MKSRFNAGQFDLRGKRSITLDCLCCGITDRRDDWERAHWARLMQIALEDDYTEAEFAADICSDEEPCWRCLGRQPYGRAYVDEQSAA